MWIILVIFLGKKKIPREAVIKYKNTNHEAVKNKVTSRSEHCIGRIQTIKERSMQGYSGDQTCWKRNISNCQEISGKGDFMRQMTSPYDPQEVKNEINTCRLLQKRHTF